MPSRRDFVRLATASAIAVSQGIWTPAEAACKLTEDNIEGPYYKAGAPFRANIAVGVKGEFLRVSGDVLDLECKPAAGAIVDVWQCDAAGVYDNAGYALRGRVRTDARGHYAFDTIVPGRYSLGGSGYGADSASFRPAHIHFRVSKPGLRTLVTQLYFEGDPFNAKDPYTKKSLIVPLARNNKGPQAGRKCVFPIVLGRA